ncbi:MAG: carboxypeptidase-like regulatory domain-containing protein, partial [Bacteroidales bacterium]|nr:carboxypeptidase-like regulatory domain-containing protein [Bacteroidales bacterium]
MASICAFAQVTTSSVSGTVSDKDGAILGAPVVAIHHASGSRYYSVTDKNGAYRINAITPGGPYTVVVEMLGYRKVETTGVYAPLGETVTVNFKLDEESISLDAAVFT